MSREDVENQFAAINNDSLSFLLEMSSLRRRQIVVEDDQFGTRRIDQILQFLDLSLPQARSRMRSTAHLNQFTDDLDARRLDQPLQFIKSLFFPKISTRIGNRNQDGGTMLGLQFFSNRFCQERFRSGILLDVPAISRRGFRGVSMIQRDWAAAFELRRREDDFSSNSSLFLQGVFFL